MPGHSSPVKVLGHWAVKLVVAALVAAFAIVSFLGWNPHYWLRELQLIDVAAIMGATLVLMAGSKAGLQAIVISVIVLLASIPVWLPGNKLSTSGSQDSPGATQSAAPDNTNSSMPLDPGNTIAIWESSLPRLAVVDQNMMVTRKAAETFWGLKFSWTDPSALSSFGLESITVPGSATVYDEILFQYEGFTIHGDDPHCHPWTTGLGINCNVIYPINSSHRYGLRMKRESVDGISAFWGIWVLDLSAGTTTPVARIGIASSAIPVGITDIVTDFASPQVGCRVGSAICGLVWPSGGSVNHRIGQAAISPVGRISAFELC